MKHNTQFFILFCLGCLLFTACGDDRQKTPAVATNTGDTAETVTEVPEEDVYAAIRAKLDEGVDYGGEAFNVISYNHDGWSIYIDPESESGDTLNDAAYRRNLEVEDMLGIDIVGIYEDDYEKKFRNAVMAGDSTYDLICFWAPGDYSGFITDQIAYDWTAVPYLNLDAAWYNQTANDAYSINGRQFFAVSDFTYPVHQHFRILYNKELYASLQYDTTPYDDVFAGTWTFDKMLEYCEGVYHDLNGDNKADLEDRYGLVLNNAFSSMFPLCSGELPVSCGEDGFHFNLYSERIVSIVEDIVSFASNPDVYLNPEKSGNEQYDIFNAENALFMTYGSDPLDLRALEFDFGYLPYPKYDEQQKDYVVFSAGGLMAIPNSITDPARTGLIIEALSAASHKYVKDAFVEQYIENKILRDEESQKIYRMMRDLATYDLSYNIDPSGMLADYAYYSYFMEKRDPNVASRYEKMIQKIEKRYQNMYDLIVSQE